MKIIAVFLLLMSISFSRADRGITGEKTLLFMGDSLTAGYGVARKNSYPEIIVSRLRKQGKKVKMVNGSISGSLSLIHI